MKSVEMPKPLEVVCGSELLPKKRMVSLKTLADCIRFNQKVINLVAREEISKDVGRVLGSLTKMQGEMITADRVMNDFEERLESVESVE
jgi:hypothetical protein